MYPIQQQIFRFFGLLMGLLLGIFPILHGQKLQNITERFEQYAGKTLQEKLYLHTDQNFYMSGDILWYKLYYVDGQSHKPLALSKVAYLELLDADGKPVIQQTILMEKGGGEGSMYLPLSVLPGNYRLRCYTNYMKNLGPEYFFRKDISIVNPFTPLGLTAAATEEAFQVACFPEGGELVAGLQSKVALKVTDRFGKGQAFTGVLLGENADTLTTFSSHKFGMGSFIFTPQNTAPYRLFLLVNGDSVTSSLPAAKPSGFVLSLSHETENKLNVKVQMNDKTDMPVAYLLAHTRQELKIAQVLKLVSGETTISLSTEALGEGISHFTLFNSEKQPVCERLFFKQPSNPLKIEASASKAVWQTREKVTVSVKARAVNPSLSMAVYRLDGLPMIEKDEILPSLWLTSDLKGKVESPGYYFQSNSIEVEKAAELLMLTHGWRRFDWEEVIRDGAPSLRFLPEYEGRIINATVTDKDLNRNEPSVTAFLSIPGKHFQFYVEKSDKRGNLSFITEKVFGINKLVVQTNHKEDSNYKISVQSPYVAEVAPKALPQFMLNIAQQDTIRQRSIATQAQNVYYEDQLHRFQNSITDTFPFYGKADKVYLLDDFTRFPTMEEVMREYVHEVMVRKTREGFRFYVFNNPAEEYFRENPLVLIDGVPVFDIDKIMEVEPLNIQRLEVMSRKMLIGNNMFYGLVNYTTYKGNVLEWYELNPNALEMPYDGLQRYRKFYEPNYEQAGQRLNRMPDFRHLLYWSPELPIGEGATPEVSFYTSDLPGEYLGVVEGLAEDGSAGSAYFTFTVTPKSSN